jgi:hypothetical protein
MTRSKVVVLVGGLSALGGAIAGAVSALIAVTVATPVWPVSAGEIALTVAENAAVGGVAGCLLGTIVAFGALRRVPLGKLILSTNVGLAAGLTASWLAGAWASHHFGLLGFAGFSAGAVVARAFSRGTSRLSSQMPTDSIPASTSIGAERVARKARPEQ